jgi:hypothetical protein
VAVAVELRRNQLERLAFGAGTATIALAALAASLPGARHYALWQDEVASARVISEPRPTAMLEHVAHTESTPPLWYAIAWLVHRCGAGIADVRLVSVAAAALLAVVTTVTARRLVPAWAALLSGLAVALGYQFDFHGRELRAYELAALLTVALALAAERAMALPSRRNKALLAGAVAAGSSTHYFFLFSAAAVICWRRETWRAVAVGLVPIAVWSPVLVHQYERHRFSFIGPFDAHTVATTYWTTFARAQPHGELLHDAAPFGLLAAVLVGAVTLGRRSETGRLWALLAVVPVALAGALWLLGAHIYDVRNLIGVGPFAAVCAAAGLARAPRTSAAPAACALAALLVVGYARASRVPPVAYDRIAAALLTAGWQPDNPIVVHRNVYALWGPLEWYLPNRPTLVLHHGVPSSAVAFAIRGTFVTRIRQHAHARHAVTYLTVRSAP